MLGVVAQSDPEESEYEWGEAVGAVDSFIFAHEFGHAPIDFFGRQDPPQLAEYADNHSFDRQRADNILCWIGGAEEELLVAFVENGVLPEAEEGKKSAAEGWGRAPSAFTPAEHG